MTVSLLDTRTRDKERPRTLHKKELNSCSAVRMKQLFEESSPAMPTVLGSLFVKNFQ